jgi:hypothetical protein
MPVTAFTSQGADGLEFSVNPVYPGRLEVSPGLAIGLTEGGEAYAYGKGRPCVVHVLSFEDMPSADFDGGFDYATGAQTPGTQSLVNWFVNVAPPGGGGFTYSDPFGGSHTVAFADARLDFSLTSLGFYSVSIRLREYIGQ